MDDFITHGGTVKAAENQGDTDQGDMAPENQGDTTERDNPTGIYRRFEERWAGTQAELLIALEDFYNDIRSSLGLALEDVETTSSLTDEKILTTLDDYVTNHYLS